MKKTYCTCGACREYVELVDCRKSESEIIGQCETCGATNVVDAPDEPQTTYIQRRDGRAWEYGNK